MLVWVLLGWLALMSMVSVEALLMLRQAIVPRAMVHVRAVSSRGNSTPAQSTKALRRPGDSKRSDAKRPSAGATPVQTGDIEVKDADDSTKLAVEAIISSHCSARRVSIGSISWPKGRCEVTVTKATTLDEPLTDESSSSGISSEDLHDIHRAVYRKMEEDPALARLLQTTEILIATPGISDVLTNDRDFQTFRAFPVELLLLEEFKKAMKLEGTLVKRDDAFVHISTKGRPISVPRAIIREVRLAPSKFEDADHEMKKLR